MSTILVEYLTPLQEEHAHAHINAIRTHDGPAAPPSDDHEWEIKNKYYSATVAFKLLQTTSPDGDEPAIIVLAPRTSSPPELLGPLLAQFSSREPEFEVALLVAYPHSASAASSSVDEDAWDDLALEHGFEWVDLAIGNGVGARIEEEGEDRIGEQRGVARVVAALHSHMWEGMVEAPKKAKPDRIAPNRRIQPNADDPEGQADDDDDDFAALGAPPLPDPRPFIPTPLSFPSTFLPSLSRSSHPPSSTPPLPPITTSLPPSSPTPFDDDFAPFVPALPNYITSFPPLTSPISPLTTSLTTSHTPTPLSATVEHCPDVASPLYRHPALSFPDGLDDGAEEGEEEDDDPLGEGDLEDLVERLRGFKAEADAMQTMEERRAFAERVVDGLGLLSLSENI